VASGIELIRFHGFGNETSAQGPVDHYRVFQNVFRIEPSWVLASSGHRSLSVGMVAQYTATREAATTVVGQQQPYGSGRFGEAGLRAALRLDERDVPNAPTRGYRLDVSTTLYPPLLDVERAFATSRLSASAYLGSKMPLEPVLALRAGAQHVWGGFPFHDAAFLGGVSSLRGFDEQRFAGRSSLWGTSELRLFVAKSSAFIPADFGVFGFADIGRVFTEGDHSDLWHTSTGGGVWLAPLTRGNTLSLGVGRSVERTGIYVRSGFAF